MKLVTAAEMRELDRRTIEEAEIPGEVLMDRAGQGVADAVRRMMDSAGFPSPFVHVIAGRGNNAGDGFVAARLLKESGVDVEVWLACTAGELTGDAMKHFSLMKSAGVAHEELDTRDVWDEAVGFPLPAEIVVDGILGTGTTGPARGPVAGAIHYVKSRATTALVVSIDLPSGLDADSGTPLGDTVVADLTVTLGLPKRGLVQPGALPFVGSVDVVDIGIPPEYVADIAGDEECEMVFAADLRPLLARRRQDAHKGSFGRVLLIGGAAGYGGAIAMAARAAVRSGAGRVTALVPERIVPVVSSASLETMVFGEAETREGSLSMQMWTRWRMRFDEYDAILIGPGMTRHDDTLYLVRELVRQSRTPLVVDADALAVLENQPDWITKALCPVVVTPHPGEMGMLFGQAVETVQAHRSGMAVAAAKYMGCTVVLKGAGTVVATEGERTAINLTGNPGMATGGTGDVLAGLIAGLLAQGMPPHDAARLGVYLHGRAGDLVAWRKSQAGLIATDLIDEIAYAYREVTLR